MVVDASGATDTTDIQKRIFQTQTNMRPNSSIQGEGKVMLSRWPLETD